jgi:hypothetical protein
LSEPSKGSPLVRAADSDGFTNPILYIEELRRLPPARSRAPAPGTTLVFRARDGRLRAPRGGYTAGELFFLGPRTGYQIDTSPHGFTASFEVGSALVEVAGRWRVTDPVAVVANRISDLEYACTTELSERITAAVPFEVDSPEELRVRLSTAWSDGVTVPGGVLLDSLRVDAAPADAFTGERVIQFLVADDEEPDAGDPGGADHTQLLRELAELARDGLAEHGQDGTAGRALLRFHELVGRMGDVLPSAGGERAGDDRAR